MLPRIGIDHPTPLPTTPQANDDFSSLMLLAQCAASPLRSPSPFEPWQYLVGSAMAAPTSRMPPIEAGIAYCRLSDIEGPCRGRRLTEAKDRKRNKKAADPKILDLRAKFKLNHKISHAANYKMFSAAYPQHDTQTYAAVVGIRHKHITRALLQEKPLSRELQIIKNRIPRFDGEKSSIYAKRILRLEPTISIQDASKIAAIRIDNLKSSLSLDKSG